MSTILQNTSIKPTLKSTNILGITAFIIAGAVTIVFVGIINGQVLLDIYYNLLSWLINGILATLTFYALEINPDPSNTLNQFYNIISWFVPPTLLTLISIPHLLPFFYESESYEYAIGLIHLLNVINLFFLLRKPLIYVISNNINLFENINGSELNKNESDKKNKPLQKRQKRQQNINKDIVINTSRSNESLLGSGVSIMDKVINSMVLRAKKSEQGSFTYLVFMLLIVFFGMSLSIGTIALNEFSNIGELQKHRNRFIDLNSKIDSIVKTGNTIDKKSLVLLKSQMNSIIKEKYGDAKDYKELVGKIEKGSAISWPDIIMRIAIATLSLFIVQILFNIYKYNQHQASHLYAKAEIIELFKETEADKKDLRTGLLSKLDSGPGFGQGPISPTEQVINIIDKFPKAGG